MSEHPFFEYRAKLISAAHIEDRGEPIHCLIKMEIGAGHERSRELREQEAGDLVFLMSIRDRIVKSPIPALAR
jgi:hypothetical protein